MPRTSLILVVSWIATLSTALGGEPANPGAAASPPAAVVNKGWVPRAPRQVRSPGGLVLQGRGKKLIVRSYALEERAGEQGFAVKELTLPRPAFDDPGDVRDYIRGYHRPGSQRRLEIQSRRAFRTLLDTAVGFSLTTNAHAALLDAATARLARAWPTAEGHTNALNRAEVLRVAAQGLIDGLRDRWALYVPGTGREHAGLLSGRRGAEPGFSVRRGRTGEVVVDWVDEGSPAQRAGLRVRDRLVGRSGRSVVGLKYEDALAALLQKPEGEFRLDVRRAGRALDIGFTPRPYRPIVVSSRLLSNGVAVIRIRRFDKGVAKQVARALEALASRPGGTLRGLVLDLRGNPGGITEEAGETGRLFLAGPFASVRGLHDETVLEGPASPRFGALEVVVLTDDETTSAAEVLAGSMQARGRAKIFGRTTAGKADSQVPMLLADGAFARMTVARTYLANGTTFADVGVKPDRKAEDIVQEFRATGRHPRDAVLRAAIEALTRSRPATHE